LFLFSSGCDTSNVIGPLVIPGTEEVALGDATKRIAIENCDWDNIKAEDLMYV
jgi:hypothetical protein